MSEQIENIENVAELTVAEFGEMVGCDYLTANNVIKFFVGRGVFKEGGKRPMPEGKRGKPSQLYIIPNEVEFVFWEKNEDKTPVIDAPVNPVETEKFAPA